MRRRLLAWAVPVFLLSSATASAQEAMQTLLDSRQKQFVIVVGGSAVRFDASIKYSDRETGSGFFIDPEGMLGLPDRQEVPTLTMLVAVNGRHFISVGATRFQRESGVVLLEDTDLGDLEIENATVDLWLNSNDFDISYGYRFFSGDHIRILGKFGIYALDLDAGIIAEGEWSYANVLETGTYERHRTLIAPLPLLGILFNFYVDRRWALATTVDAMYLPVGDITGRALRSKINARYAFGKTVGITFGINYFDVHVTDKNDDRKWDIKYGYDGFFAGLIFAF
jgi:hypothetical protein